MLANALRMKTFLEQGAAMIEVNQVWRNLETGSEAKVKELDPNGWVHLDNGRLLHQADLFKNWSREVRTPKPNDVWENPNDGELYIVRAISKDTPFSSVLVQAWSADRGAQGAKVATNLKGWRYMGTEQEALEMRKAIEEMENEIKEGDVVRLKCGGPTMVVCDTEKDVVRTAWHLADGSISCESIPKTILIRLPETSGI